ncbi:hypothetical protein OS493_035907 [Desmophyllum pertusum]|uniref:Uncharacterized protein n=1 Tax=Desmophyllum pertusum TaxID=174260 RepID=A0A9W9Z6S6_9CNID|nr:hypothetical protein OS493_035907 [Desmophyllum pertusum]
MKPKTMWMVVEEDWIKAPMTMKKEDKSLEKVVRNYEKELDVLRKIAPNQDDENTSITDIIKEYEDKIDDLENRNKGLQEEHGRLVSRIGSDLVDDILTLPLVGDESVGDKIHQSEGDLSEPSETFKFNDTSRLNAPVIMNKDDSTLEDVLQIYEKALGLLPRPPIPRDDSFDDFKRENKILKDALGDSLATDLIAIAEKATPPISGNIKPMSYLPDESKQSQVGELKSQSEEKTKSVGNPAENAKQSGEQDRDDDMPSLLM